MQSKMHCVGTWPSNGYHLAACPWIAVPFGLRHVGGASSNGYYPGVMADMSFYLEYGYTAKIRRVGTGSSNGYCHAASLSIAVLLTGLLIRRAYIVSVHNFSLKAILRFHINA